jgi:hypothetical protein
MGVQALGSNTGGSQNTAIGREALASNDQGSGNTASGVQALTANMGYFNTAAGFQALGQNTSGNGNMAVGLGALHLNTTGSDNTGIGNLATVSRGDLQNATVIGFQAIVDANNKIRLGNTAVTVIKGQVPYTFTSDKHQKEKFRPVDGDEVLRKLAARLTKRPVQSAAVK